MGKGNKKKRANLPAFASSLGVSTVEFPLRSQDQRRLDGWRCLHPLDGSKPRIDCLQTLQIYCLTWWWLGHPSENILVNWDDEIPNIWENKKMFQTTNQTYT